MYKLTVYIPESHLEVVKDALFAAGAGRYAAYDRCCWQVLGQGQFRPLAGSDPFIGTHGQEERVPEYRVEMICAEDAVEAVTRALRAAHPYEEPAFDFVRITM
ncbi:MAG TPA: NGG1p interacting factor NIF3 [Kiritimatiellia bacterium]|nr:NGG1p interacting factor NIF3 [Kiritimatiellia bacterium]HRU69962.1 NGG1p interacting factor NIF3 [Kiritimatiellia bacterium]